MIKLILDTNILHQEGLNSGRMQLLKKLIDVEFVHLYIPELVKYEFITKRTNTTTEAMLKSANGLKTIAPNFELSEEFKADLNEIENSIRAKIDLVAEEMNVEFSDWAKNYRVTELAFNPEDINSVMNDYFNGKGVYRSIKSRDDIPDAMINTCIEKLISDVGEVSIIIKDGVFRKYLEKNSSINIFDSLSDFFKAEAVEALKDKAEKVEIVKEYLVSDEAITYFYEYFSNLSGEISWIYLDDDALLNKELIAERVYNVEINSEINENIENLSINNLYPLTAQNFVGDLSFEIDTTVHFITDYSTYLEIENDKSRTVDIESMNGDGICDLYEDYRVRFFGQIEIVFDESFDESVVKVLMRNIKQNEETIRVNFDLKSCELILDED